MVSSGIEPLIPALLARCLNQLGQETKNLYDSPEESSSEVVERVEQLVLLDMIGNLDGLDLVISDTHMLLVISQFSR